MIRIFTIFTISLTSLLFSRIELSVGTVDDTNDSIEILINTDVDIVGFQFDLEGVDLTGGSGGLAADNGFDIYASGNTTLGFSLTGEVIPSGSDGLLTVLSGEITGEICLPFVQGVGPEDDTPIFSDAEGNALEENEIGDGSCDSMFNEDNQIIFSLFNAYPNPFNPDLSIDIIIPEAGVMNVSAYNLNGQHIETLYNGFASSNTLYDLVWDASKLSSGLYIIKVESVDFKYSRVVSLLK